jgi:hypothetical protein
MILNMYANKTEGYKNDIIAETDVCNSFHI